MTNRKEFAKIPLFNILETITEKVEKENHLIGGLAMIFYGTKLATKDVDIVFDSNENVNVFVKAMKIIGFSEVKNLTGEYLNLEAHHI